MKQCVVDDCSFLAVKQRDVELDLGAGFTFHHDGVAHDGSFEGVGSIRQLMGFCLTHDAQLFSEFLEAHRTMTDGERKAKVEELGLGWTPSVPIDVEEMLHES